MVRYLVKILCLPAALLLLVGCKPPAPPPAASNLTAAEEPKIAMAPPRTLGEVQEEGGVAEPAPAEPAPSEPAPSEPAPSEPAPTDPAPSEPAPSEPAPTEPAPASEPEPTTPPPVAASDLVKAGDWMMWGGDMSRNMINPSTGLKMQLEKMTRDGVEYTWDGEDYVGTKKDDEGKDKKVTEHAIPVEQVAPVLWTVPLGSQTYGNPVVANGKVLVGTNNGGEYRPQHKGDRGVVLCFSTVDGKFLWQLTREKLPEGRVNDWPEQGICSTPCVINDRCYIVTNRCEVLCLDMEGFHDGENDGMQEEVDKEELDADIIWKLDMMDELGVFPHNLATSSPVFYDGMLYLVTSNGVDEAHLEIPAPRSPSFIAVDAETGKVVWEDNTPFDKILHGQWSSPAIGVVNGKAQVYFPGGNGWLYAMDAKTGEHIWEFDLNPKDSKWELGGSGTRNAIIGTPVFFENSVILGVGQDPEHGEGVGHLYRIDATKLGDVSPVTPEGQPNSNSGQIWHYGGVDEDGSQTGEAGGEVFRRTLSTVAVADGLVYAPDLGGRFHCIDAQTGKRQWEADLLSAIWGSPMCVDGKVLLGDEDGYVTVFDHNKVQKILGRIEFRSSIYSTPTIAHGVMFVSDRSQLYAIKLQD